MAMHELRVGPLPVWLDAQRLLGDADPAWSFEGLDPGGIEARAQLSSEAAADLAARLRGLGFDGRALTCTIEPPLRRSLVRRARSEDARRRRATTPGFERPGARVDEIGRMSLTPERLAMQVAAWAERRPIVDAGCGVGGNAIAFARAGSPVIAIELDADRLALARHNARLYGVADRIEFVHGDARELVPQLADAQRILFVDPPWGADWDRQRCTLADLPLLSDLLAELLMPPLGGRETRPEQIAPRGAKRPGAKRRFGKVQSLHGGHDLHGYTQLWLKLPPSFAATQLLARVGDGEGRVDALFGEAEGDRRRVKFVLVRATT